MFLFVPDTRETGFVNAITAAGVTYAVTRACTMGDLVECSCDRAGNNKKSQAVRTAAKRIQDARLSAPVSGTNIQETDWEWGGCGDNVNFGLRKSRDFLDARYRKRSDIKTLVKLHNNNAGRMVSSIFVSLKHTCVTSFLLLSSSVRSLLRLVILHF